MGVVCFSQYAYIHGLRGGQTLLVFNVTVWVFHLFLGLALKLFPYSMEFHHYRFCLTQSYIHNPFALSRVVLEIYIFPFSGVHDPLLFSVVRDSVTRILQFWYGDYVGYFFWFYPVIQSSQFFFILDY